MLYIGMDIRVQRPSQRQLPFGLGLFGFKAQKSRGNSQMPTLAIEPGSISQAELGRRSRLAIPTLRIRLAWAGVRGTRTWPSGPLFFSPTEVQRFEAWLSEHAEDRIPA